MSVTLVIHFQMLDGRKGIAELDRGGAGQDKAFWEDVVLEFNDYSPQKGSYGALVVTSTSDKRPFSEKNVDPSIKGGADKSWESLKSIYLIVQKDYKKKFEQFKTSGNHESNFHDFCHGSLNTYYLHFWLQLRDSNILEAVVEDLSDDVRFESNNTNDDERNNSISSLSTTTTAAKKIRKSPADVLEKHLKEKEQRRNDNDLLKVQKVVRVQLKSYCMGMKQLLSMNKYMQSCTDDEEQQQLIQCMKSTVGVAVSQMESHIHAGTIWCPTSEQEVTPISSEKEVDLELETSSLSDKDDYSCASPEKSFCCAGEYCWKKITQLISQLHVAYVT
jgi:hypothetical protein